MCLALSLRTICRKKNGNIRVGVDYRRLNTKMRKDALPLPRVDEMFEAFALHIKHCQYPIVVGRGYIQSSELNVSDL